MLLIPFRTEVELPRTPVANFIILGLIIVVSLSPVYADVELDQVALDGWEFLARILHRNRSV